MSRRLLPLLALTLLGCSLLRPGGAQTMAAHLTGCALAEEGLQHVDRFVEAAIEAGADPAWAEGVTRGWEDCREREEP